MLNRKKHVFFYWIKLTIKSSTIYKKRIILQMIRMLFNFVVMMYVWSALEKSSIGITTSLDILILYSAISTLITCIIQQNQISTFFQNEIICGNIGQKLIRPVPIEVMAIWNSIGNSITGLLIYGLTFIIALYFLIDVNVNITLFSGIMFWISLLLGYGIYVLIDLICAYTCFYIHKGSTVEHLFEALFMAFSGQIIPSFMLPHWFQEISYFFPVRLVYEDPISILLNMLTIEQLFFTFIREIVWISILGSIALMLNRIIRKKVFIQGG